MSESPVFRGTVEGDVALDVDPLVQAAGRAARLRLAPPVLPVLLLVLVGGERRTACALLRRLEIPRPGRSTSTLSTRTPFLLGRVRLGHSMIPWPAHYPVPQQHSGSKV